MKKIVVSLLVVMMVLSLAACGGKSNNVDGDLSTLMNQLYEGLDELPMLEQVEVNDENFAWEIGANDDFKLDGYEEALVSAPMMSSIAHTVLLVRMKDGADINAAKKAIKENVNPYKWICVGIEDENNVIVDNRGNLIVLIMDNEKAQAIHNNFKNLK